MPETREILWFILILMVKIAHIINSVKVKKESDLYIAQPVTFQSMVKAKKYNEFSNNIQLFNICYEEDRDLVPDEFTTLPYLEKSVLDHGNFTKQKKLPLIRDILLPLKNIDDIDYIIYTNVDIALMPFFYDYIISKINNGSDSLIINRRIITEASDLGLMYAEVGKPHAGYDCFVFRRELLHKFDFGESCIGANWIGRVFISNLITYSRKLEILKDGHLTFHIGDDGAWLSNNYSDYDLHNKNIAYQLINKFLKEDLDQNRKEELKEILQFMEQWGKPREKKVKTKRRPSMAQKIKKKVTKFLK